MIGLERIPNLYEREKHSLYDPGKEKTLSIKVIVISINDMQHNISRNMLIMMNRIFFLPNSVADFFHR